ncbi:hypothetical protein [Microvirga puerhi]|uniref:GNAT family N-acetyltransferase n=1 Tax=Microvirga puerhi TaxID=2876078 RepID=A0ABS7VUF2_9HYPH|nr:hypothetical protein [Microvirga puerhi]MBZ6078804.1 hypothetical protein [Microvirga puerhi]
MISEIYQVERIGRSNADRIYALISLLHPNVTWKAWQRFVRQAARLPRRVGGLVAVQDQRGCCHAIFSYRVAEAVAGGAVLWISDVVIGRLPGATLPKAIINFAEGLADELGSSAILMDLPHEMIAPGDAEILAQTGFHASGVVLTRRLQQAHPVGATR